MKNDKDSPSQRHLAIAHLWSFSAGIDTSALDANGIPLAHSLADLIQQRYDEGRAEAAAAYLQATQCDPIADLKLGDQTGSYDMGQLRELLEQVSSA